jgi:hypothetical protein
MVELAMTGSIIILAVEYIMAGALDTVWKPGGRRFKGRQQ